MEYVMVPKVTRIQGYSLKRGPAPEMTEFLHLFIKFKIIIHNMTIADSAAINN